MKKSEAPVKFCLLILLAVCCWRMFGAPVTMDDLRGVGQHFGQARILLPQRVQRICRLWMANTSENVNLEAGVQTDSEDVVSVYLTSDDKLVEMTVEEYVQGVIAAEMPAQYHLEALKAQAVAARTRLMWQIGNGGCELHSDADICTDSTHCQGYATVEECLAKWQDSYHAYYERIARAQRETAGHWIAYNNQPITVLYHAISGGYTENAETVFSEQLPYLISVESRNEENTPGFQQEITLSYDEVAKRLESGLSFPLTEEEVQRTFSIGGYTESGRVKEVQIGQSKIAATEVREMLGLRSTWFSISMDQEGITFYQRGYGHGVGMSQAGANSMAAAGADYEQIIKHYYTGVSIVN